MTEATWLEDYADDIQALENVGGLFDSNLESIDEFADKYRRTFDDVIEPLKDGTIDSNDLEIVVDRWMQNFGKVEIEDAKKRVELHRQMSGLYDHLTHANDDEWEDYVKHVVMARFSARNNLLYKLILDFDDES